VSTSLGPRTDMIRHPRFPSNRKIRRSMASLVSGRQIVSTTKVQTQTSKVLVTHWSLSTTTPPRLRKRRYCAGNRSRVCGTSRAQTRRPPSRRTREFRRHPAPTSRTARQRLSSRISRTRGLRRIGAGFRKSRAEFSGLTPLQHRLLAIARPLSGGRPQSTPRGILPLWQRN
jgi:hypothetical protein